MAVPQPTNTIVIPTDWEDRGINFISPETKSTKTKVSVYCEFDACELFYYTVGSQSMTIIEQIDCKPVLQATASLSIRVPEGTSSTEQQKLITELTSELLAEIASKTC